MMFHHGKNIVHYKQMFYKGGSEIIVEGQDSDKWCFFEPVSLIKD